ncbi:AraC family transcriptional regulator with amidase-like domain [Paraburkholderia silvatlantica]|uniref:AraC family transcriptional regulator with amidase-like domain n=1 Tax=Paraburkholderia silvatlantica TaxID=321895 RepID=A0A2V4UIN3_9BURK|nr:acetamidase/formamidase family protein [Paraburkholderia silvatlantica]PYE19693.1 AraC family transcriptional regulator with amidase-like domain [Paraburkholderia silvatlantica]
MEIERFTTESWPVPQRAHVWREILKPHSLSPAMVTRANIPLYGLLTAARTARGAALVRIASSPQTLARMHANRETDDRFWLALHQAGHAEFHDGTRSFELSPGDIVFGPAHHTFDLTFHSDFRQFQISLPGAAVQARLPCARSLSPAHLSGQAGLGRLLAGTLTGLADTFDTLNDEQVASVESSLFDYLASSLNASADDAAAAAGKHQAAALYRVCQLIENTLSDSTLSLTMVASSQNMSERLVQKLFDGTGQTFTGYLRQRRLERCCSDLANRQYGHLSISDICFRWGFNDAAHFSHAFRDRYGLSPRQYRRQTTEASEQKLRKRIQRGWPPGYFEPQTAAAALDPDTDASSARTGAHPASAAGPVASGRHFHLPATPETIHWGYLSRDIASALTIDSGDIVTIETLTQHAYDDYERMIKGDSGAERVFQWTREGKAVERRGAGPTDASIYGRGSGEGFGVHICTGPIYVKEAQPGDVLEVRILDIAPRLAANAKYEGRAFGSNAATWWGFHYDDLLEEPKPREVVTIYEVNCSAGENCAHAVYNFRWTTQRDPQGVEHRTIDYPGVPVERDSIVENHGVLEGVTIPVRPHFGVVALAPAETGLVDSVPPSHFGGNIDNWRVTKGATLYLRVAAVGGLLSVGDPHASQGDGELCGTAIECSFTGVFQVILHKAESLTSEPFADIDYPLIETPDEWVLQGFSHPNYLKELGERAPSLVYERSSLDSAMRDAFRKTRRFLMTAFSLSEDEAISLISVAVDFSVTQVVNGNWGVHAVIRKSMFTQRLNRLNAAHSQGGATTS